MKILFCCPCPPILELGIGKHVLELAEALRAEGCLCDIVSPEEVQAESPGLIGDYNACLRNYLRHHAADYDVVDYDHAHFPYARVEFPMRTLFVARSFLLRHHFTKIKIPGRRLLKSRLRRWAYGWWYDPHQERARVKTAQRTLEEADLVNVLNDDDRLALIATAIPAGKIFTIGLGLTAGHLMRLQRLAIEPPSQPVVVSVATFDTRKGAVELPAILEHIWREIPNVRFRLLGARRSIPAVMHRFPVNIRSALEIVPEYDQASLPDLLDGCSVGIFPSYVEGFPLGVLEMQAAAIPVLAYQAPGAPMILPTECLVHRGDYKALSGKAVNLLACRKSLELARQQARERSGKFTMESVARQTKSLYLEQVQARQHSRDRMDQLPSLLF